MELVVLGRQPVAAIRRGVQRRRRELPPVTAAPEKRYRDPRYGSRRWKRVRLQVLERASWRCQVVQGCTERANVADHIIPVFRGMPDSLFFAQTNLRASCRGHNLARGIAPEVRSTAPDSAVVTRDYTKAPDGPR